MARGTSRRPWGAMSRPTGATSTSRRVSSSPLRRTASKRSTGCTSISRTTKASGRRRWRRNGSATSGSRSCIRRRCASRTRYSLRRRKRFAGRRRSSRRTRRLPGRAEGRSVFGTASWTPCTIVAPRRPSNGRASEPRFSHALSRPREMLGDREVGLPEFLEVEQLVRRTGLDNTAVLHDVAEVGDPQRCVCVLLDHQDGEAGFAQLADLDEDLRDEFRREAQARFVEDEDGGLRHQGASDADHLLLTAAEATGLYPGSFAQPREQFVDVGERLVRGGPRRLAVRAESEVSFRRQEGEQMAALRAGGDSLAGAFVGRRPRDVLSLERDVTASWPDESVDDLQRRRFTRSVGAD